MRLMTVALAATIPSVGSTGGEKDPLVRAKLFTPDGAATWLVTEYDPDERMCFGFVTLGDPDCAELGYFSLYELEGVRGRLGLRVERDLYWDVKPLSEAKKDLGC